MSIASMPDARRPFRSYVWALPATVIGLLAAIIAGACGGRWSVRQGVIEVVAGRRRARLARRCPFVAVTLGHVVVARDDDALSACRLHEYAHVRQYERWGVLFFPLYLGSSTYQWLRGGRPYYDNHFERQARAAAESPLTPSRDRAGLSRGRV